jgi:hypothetical protein
LDRRRDFKEIAGGEREAEALKKNPFDLGLIAIDRRGNGRSYVVKRKLPDGTRPYFVALRSDEAWTVNVDRSGAIVNLSPSAPGLFNALY